LSPLTQPARQRTADAIVEVCDYYNRHAHTPQRGGRPRQVIVVTHHTTTAGHAAPSDPGAKADLGVPGGSAWPPGPGATAPFAEQDRPAPSRPSPASTPDGSPGRITGDGTVSAVGVAQALCDAEIVDGCVGGDGEVLHWGRARRQASPAQKAALAVRDGGCVADGCRFADRPDRTDAHHVAWWSRDGGATDLHNLVLLCGHHHTCAHRDGWQIHVDPVDGRRSLRPPPRRHPTPLTDAAARRLPDWHADPIVPGVLTLFGIAGPAHARPVPAADGVPDDDLGSPPGSDTEWHPLDDLPDDPFADPPPPPAAMPPSLIDLVDLDFDALIPA